MEKDFKKVVTLNLLTLLIVLLVVSNNAHARDLVSAANSYTDMAKSVAKGVGLGGIIVGGIMYAVPGVDRFATRVFLGGLFSVLITYGAPMIISTVSSIFGGL